MKHFLRETGTALMALSGIAFTAVLFRLVTFFRGGEHTPAESLTFFLLLPAVCAGLFLLLAQFIGKPVGRHIELKTVIERDPDAAVVGDGFLEVDLSADVVRHGIGI